MADVKQVLRDLNIESEGSKSPDGSYVIDIPDVDTFSKYYSILDKNKEVEELVDTSLLTLHDIRLSYLYKEFMITLISDNDQDSYKIVIKPLSQKQIAELGDEEDEEEEETEDD